MSEMTVDSAPLLAGGRIPTKDDTRKSRAAAGDPWPQMPPSVYDQAFVRYNGFFQSGIIVSDPAWVRRIMIENVANYPKTDLEKRFFSTVFGNGLLSSDGDVWRAHRKVMSPSFDPRSVVGYGPMMAKTAEAFRTRWDALPDGAVIEAREEMVELTLQIISKTMFSTDSDEVVRVIEGAMHKVTEVMDPGILDLIPVISEWRFKRRDARAKAVFGEMDAAINRLIDERETTPPDGPPDLLGRLIAAKDSDSGFAMSREEVRDQVITIFLAGHETTATAMSWIWYLLSQHPAQEAKLHAELDEVLAGRAPTQEDIASLKYTRMLVDEAMRVYPPAPGISNRIALKDDVIDGETIRKGTNVVIAPWVLHRHRLLWSDPERFDPERFSPDRSAGRPRFAYMPFGGGPRVCIGQQLAINEIILILATLAQKYQLRLKPGHPVVPQAQVTLGMKHGLKMVLQRR